MLVEISHLNDAQIDALFQMYQFEWWTRGRKRDDVREMVKHSDEIIALWDSETRQLVAFARVLTDYVYRGLILDVIVESSYRGRGVGQKLMKSILDRPSLAKVEQFSLFCLPEMVPFYEKWGFADLVDSMRLMILTRSTLAQS
ncbi:MAG: GNAT family N-acetyltransferase [Cyanobacteria bacterium P01_E01_bin.42]